MNEWWDSLQPRERILVGAMGVMVAIAIIYWLLIQPLFVGAATVKDQLIAAESDLSWMRKVAPDLKASPAGEITSNCGTSLISVIDQTSKEFDLQATGQRSMPNGRVQVQFSKSSFDSLISWFGKLQSCNVSVDTANFTRNNDQSGTTNATVVVKQGNS